LKLGSFWQASLNATLRNRSDWWVRIPIFWLQTANLILRVGKLWQIFTYIPQGLYLKSHPIIPTFCDKNQLALHKS
jgi:hypothetical protein